MGDMKTMAKPVRINYTWMSQEVSKWVITPIYPINKQVITYLHAIYYLPGTS